MSRHGHPKRSPADWHFKFDINFEDANAERCAPDRSLAICATRADRHEGRRVVIGRVEGYEMARGGSRSFLGIKAALAPWHRSSAGWLNEPWNGWEISRRAPDYQINTSIPPVLKPGWAPAWREQCPAGRPASIPMILQTPPYDIKPLLPGGSRMK